MPTRDGRGGEEPSPPKKVLDIRPSEINSDAI